MKNLLLSILITAPALGLAQKKCDRAYNLADDVKEYCKTTLEERVDIPLKDLAKEIKNKTKEGKKETIDCNCVEGFKSFKKAHGYAKTAAKRAKKHPEESKEAIKEVKNIITTAVLQIEECGVTATKLKKKKFDNVID